MFNYFQKNIDRKEIQKNDKTKLHGNNILKNLTKHQESKYIKRIWKIIKKATQIEIPWNTYT